MVWEANRPLGNQPWNVADDAIRENNAALETSVAREHEPLSDATHGGKHLEGSARVHIWTGAELNTTTLNSNFNNPTSAKNKGKMVIDQPVGRFWVLYDGANGLWVEPAKVGGALAVTGALTVAGLINANNGILIPTTKTLEGPTGEAWLKNGAQTMNPLLHAARHLLGGQDQLNGIVSGIVRKSGAGPTTTATTLLTHTYDFTGRSGASTILAFAWTTIQWDQIGGDEGSTATLNIQLNDADKALDLVMRGRRDGTGVEQRQVGMMVAAFTAAAASGQKIDFELKTHTIDGGLSKLGDLKNYEMILIDLGPGVTIT